MHARLGLILLTCYLGGSLLAAEAASPTIRTVGEARVTAKPDKAEFRLSVITYGEQAAEAASINAERTEKVLSALKAELGPDAEIRTEGYRIQPNRKHSKQGPQDITGYSVHHTIFASTKDLDGLGALLDKISESGADEINSIQFSVTDSTELRRQALKEAVAKARSEADAIAEALGSQVAGVISVEEQGADALPVEPYRFDSMMETASMGAMAPPIQIGDVEVRARVTLTVELAQ